MTEIQPGTSPQHNRESRVGLRGSQVGLGDGDILNLLGLPTPQPDDGHDDERDDSHDTETATATAVTEITEITEATEATAVTAVTAEAAHEDRRHKPDNGHQLDARIETIAFEALFHGLHDTRVASLLHMLGWSDTFSCFAIAGTADGSYATARRKIHTGIRNLGGHLRLVGRRGNICAVLVAVQGAATPEVTCTALLDAFSDHQPVCLAPARPDIAGAAMTLHEAFSALAAAPAVNDLPRPMRADDVLPERALQGDRDARDELYTSVYASLLGDSEDDPTLSTISAFIQTGGSLDLTARELNVHPNTVRYRLKRAAETTGWDVTNPRESFVLQTAIAVGRIRDAAQNAD